jgi:Flp pilus assembly protein TadD
MKQFPQALYLYRSLTDADPDRASAWEGLGMSLMGQEKISEAEQAYLRAVELDHKLWKSYNSLGIIYNRTKHPIKAKSAFIRAIKLQPRQPALYNNLGMACLLGEDLTGAEWSFRRALELNPDYRRAANNLGLVLARQHRYDQALNAFERGSGTAQAHNNLGCFLAWEGDYDQAAEQFNLAQHSNPVYYPLARKHLAEVSSKQGDGLEPRTGQNKKDLELLNGYLSPPASIQSGLSQEQEPAPGQGTEAVLTTSKDKAPVDSPRKPLPPDLAFPRLENLNSGSDSTVHKERYGMRNEDANFHIMREWLKGADIEE